MASVESAPAVFRATLKITRKATGQTEEVEVVGRQIEEQPIAADADKPKE